MRFPSSQQEEKDVRSSLDQEDKIPLTSRREDSHYIKKRRSLLHQEGNIPICIKKKEKIEKTQHQEEKSEETRGKTMLPGTWYNITQNKDQPNARATGLSIVNALPPTFTLWAALASRPFIVIKVRN